MKDLLEFVSIVTLSEMNDLGKVESSGLKVERNVEKVEPRALNVERKLDKVEQCCAKVEYSGWKVEQFGLKVELGTGNEKERVQSGNSCPFERPYINLPYNKYIFLIVSYDLYERGRR